MTVVSGLHLLVSMTSQVMDARALVDARTSTPVEATMSATPGLVPPRQARLGRAPCMATNERSSGCAARRWRSPAARGPRPAARGAWCVAR